MAAATLSFIGAGVGAACACRRSGPAPTINAAIAALRFSFDVALERPDLVRHLTIARERAAGGVGGAARCAIRGAVPG